MRVRTIIELLEILSENIPKLIDDFGLCYVALRMSQMHIINIKEFRLLDRYINRYKVNFKNSDHYPYWFTPGKTIERNIWIKMQIKIEKQNQTLI